MAMLSLQRQIGDHVRFRGEQVNWRACVARMGMPMFMSFN